MFVMDPIEAEVDTIRQKIWAKIKDMTPEEMTAYFYRETEPIIKKFNIKVSDLKPVIPHRTVDDALDARRDAAFKKIQEETQGMTYEDEEAYYASGRTEELLNGVYECCPVSPEPVAI